MGRVSTTTLTDVMAGTIGVRIDLRTDAGLERVAAGRLADGDRTGNRVRLVDEITGRLIAVTLTSAHMIAYTPGRAA